MKYVKELDLMFHVVQSIHQLDSIWKNCPSHFNIVLGGWLIAGFGTDRGIAFP